MADATKILFKAEIFKTVILNDVLEHVTYDLAKPLLCEIKRVLRMDGKLYISVANKFQLREPHTLIPFLAWLRRACYDPVMRAGVGRACAYPVYPYTVKGLRKICEDAGFACKNFTWFYGWKKISNTAYINDPMLRKMVKAIRKLKLSKLAYPIAEKVSTLLFICKKDSTMGGLQP